MSSRLKLKTNYHKALNGSTDPIERDFTFLESNAVTSTTLIPTPHPLKAVILAAGAKSITDDGLPVLLQDLGGRKIAD